jgi:hypothetical protein
MTTIDEYWDRVEDALPDARLIAWDTCHKIYVALDDTEADWFRDNYDTIVEGPDDVLLATLRKWYDESCGLRFINGVRHDAVNPNAGFVDLIPQGAEEYELDDDDEWDDRDDEEDV